MITGFIWTKGNTVGTTRAVRVPEGSLKYVVGTVGSQVKPNIGDIPTAYINTLTANTDIAVNINDEIFIKRWI